MLLTYLLAVACTGPPAGLSAELDRLPGTWEPEPIERRGKQVLTRDGGFQIRRCEVGRSTLSIHYPAVYAPVSFGCRFSVRPSTSRKEVDLVFPNGRVMKGIYALDGDTLLVAVNASLGGPRPTAFNSTLSDYVFVYVLRRVPVRPQAP